MAPLSQSYSFSSQAPHLSSSQYFENSAPNPTEGLRRVTIRQLLTATQTATEDTTAFNIDGFPIKQVMLMANVFSRVADPTTGKVTYRLDDGTGRINGQRWPQLQAGDPEFADFSYARIVAELDVYKDFKSLKIRHIRPVHDGHEIYHHILHAILETLCLKRGPPVYPLPNSRTDDVNDLTLDLTLDLQRVSISEKEQPKSGKRARQQLVALVDEPPVASSSRIPKSPSSFSQSKKLALEQDILACLIDKETDKDRGVHVADFIPDLIVLNPGLTSDELSETLEDLIYRKLITTVANDEYKCI